MAGIDAKRLLGDIRELAKFGKVGTGVNRLAFSAEDLAAREWLVRRMADAGLDARIDAVGNVYGRNPRSRRTVLMGSHSDSVPNGGRLDGNLGILYGLEIARVLSERGTTSDTGLDVMSFIDEEGTFLSWFGSRHFCGEISPEDITRARNVRGDRLSDVLAAFPFRQSPAATLERDRHIAYFEPHIEQGPRLEQERKTIGVVSGIVGIRNFYIKAIGQADHAGTTPMSMRRDAGAALIRIANRLLEQFAAAAGADTVWNFGTIAFKPGGRSVVPSEAETTVQFRDSDVRILQRFEAILQREVEELNRSSAVACSIVPISATDPIEMSHELTRELVLAAEARRVTWTSMPSGAGHDAAVLAKHVPAAMMFIPSIGGRSHCLEEDSSEEDIAVGAEIALSFVERVLNREKLGSREGAEV